ncbi:hypothetical protein M501DRAFT_1058019 [Patellaria atrata CBS 101060]|uniref:Ubiquitin-like protease family profile domain-containing protein n=1 Tax=Patellaria atrata CBS 101060 TaxID=1346257 RepID=A0A9P4SBT7_9PEZI|nr:hypothetical protein M501DRAFT_1058019 [Patellaria atrata CBS 101060]
MPPKRKPATQKVQGFKKKRATSRGGSETRKEETSERQTEARTDREELLSQRPIFPPECDLPSPLVPEHIWYGFSKENGFTKPSAALRVQRQRSNWQFGTQRLHARLRRANKLTPVEEPVSEELHRLAHDGAIISYCEPLPRIPPDDPSRTLPNSENRGLNNISVDDEIKLQLITLAGQQVSAELTNATLELVRRGTPEEYREKRTRSGNGTPDSDRPFWLRTSHPASTTVNGEVVRDLAARGTDPVASTKKRKADQISEDGTGTLIGPLNGFSVIEFFGHAVFFWPKKYGDHYRPDPRNVLQRLPQRVDDARTTARNVCLNPLTESASVDGGDEEVAGASPTPPAQEPIAPEQEPITPAQEPIISEQEAVEPGPDDLNIRARESKLQEVDQDPCTYLRGELKKKVSSGSAKIKIGKPLQLELVRRAVATVTQALSESSYPIGLVDHAAAKLAEDGYHVRIFATGSTVELFLPLEFLSDDQNHITGIRFYKRGASITVHLLDPSELIQGGKKSIENFFTSLLRNLQWPSGIGRREEYQLTFADPLPVNPSTSEDQTWSSGIYAIVNSWIAATRLKINEKMGRLGIRFYTEAIKIIGLALDGELDFPLLYAFLRCHDYVHKVDRNVWTFNTTVALSSPDIFKAVTQSLRHPQYVEALQNRFWDSRDMMTRALVECSVDVWSSDSTDVLRSKLEDLLEPDYSSPSAQSTPTSSTNRFIRRLIQIFCKNPDDVGEAETAILEKYLVDHWDRPALGPKLSLADVRRLRAANKDPCEDLDNEINRALSSTGKDLVTLVHDPGPPDVPTRLLDDQQVALAVTSVTEAITVIGNHQFSAIGPNALQFCRENIIQTRSTPAIRPGSTLILPWVWNTVPDFGKLKNLEGGQNAVAAALKEDDAKGHIVLLVIDSPGDEDTHPRPIRARIADTMPRYLQEFQLESGPHKGKLPIYQVVNETHNALHKSKWIEGRTIIVPEKLKCARQRFHWDCGWMTIANAWAIALGLTPNEDFNPTMMFYTRLAMLINLAVSGGLDFLLLYRFFKCSEFTLDEYLPSAGVHFPATFKFENVPALEVYLEKISEREDIERQVAIMEGHVNRQSGDTGNGNAKTGNRSAESGNGSAEDDSEASEEARPDTPTPVLSPTTRQMYVDIALGDSPQLTREYVESLSDEALATLLNSQQTAATTS